ncbi:MAG: secretion protein HlyD, HlyD family secretion protein [Candidatus Rokubacteria bacterium CSP1-6]|nr:MAG: secretion protein HlyD, HlyD family secretion protein [Candidatus Rokubacteria bacterium CSP1-6]
MSPSTRSRLARITAVLLVVAALAVGGPLASRFLNSLGVPTIQVTGNMEATQVDVSAKIAGRILSLRVREGDRVTEGQLLVRLDGAELKAEVERAEAALKSAEAQLRDLLAGARRQEIEEARATVDRAQSQLNDLLAGSRREEIEQAREAMRSAEATRVWTERDLKRAQELFAKELIAMQEVDRARQAYEVAVAQERSARANLQMVEAGPRRDQIEAARAQLKAVRDHLDLLLAGPRPFQVEAARGQVSQARAALDLAGSRLREAAIVSPINGVVLRKNLEAGEMANSGVSILTLVDPTDLWLRAYVPETDIGRIKVGMAARITIDAYKDRTFSGKITEIASEAEFTPKNVQTKKERVNLVFRIKIAVDNPQGLLKPGMPADADILL